MTTHAEFLPAAREIEGAAPPVAVRALSWCLLLLVAVAATWTWCARVEVVAVAPGKVVPAGRVKEIQTLQAGVVRAIHVREGERVATGAVLVELDSTEPGADVAQARARSVALALEQGRLHALLYAVDTGGLQGALPEVPGATPAQVVREWQRVRAEFKAHQSRLHALDEEQRRRGAERAAAQVRRRQWEATVPMITERAAAQARLVEQHLLPRSQWLELEQQRLAQTGQRDAERHAVTMLEAAVAGLAQQRITVAAEFTQGLLAQLDDVEMRIAALEQESVRAAQRLALQVLKAPVAGIVQRLTVQTLGGVVTPAQSLMQIVPEDVDLEIEAWARNQDAGQVRAGQPVIIKIEAFPFTRYGTLPGTLLGVAPDAVADPQQGLVYAARVGLARSVFTVDGRSVRLTPGMAATVEVKLGQRRIAEYLLSPLLRYRDEALRER